MPIIYPSSGGGTTNITNNTNNNYTTNNVALRQSYSVVLTASKPYVVASGPSGKDYGYDIALFIPPAHQHNMSGSYFITVLGSVTGTTSATASVGAFIEQNAGSNDITYNVDYSPISTPQSVVLLSSSIPLTRSYYRDVYQDKGFLTYLQISCSANTTASIYDVFISPAEQQDLEGGGGGGGGGGSNTVYFTMDPYTLSSSVLIYLSTDGMNNDLGTKDWPWISSNFSFNFVDNKYIGTGSMGLSGKYISISSSAGSSGGYTSVTGSDPLLLVWSNTGSTIIYPY